MPSAYRIRNWDQEFEPPAKAGSRAGPLGYVKVSCVTARAVDDREECIRELVGEDQFAAAWGVWTKLLRIAADQPRGFRGLLLDDRQRPLTDERIGRIMRFPIKQVRAAMVAFRDSEVGWLEIVEMEGQGTLKFHSQLGDSVHDAGDDSSQGSVSNSIPAKTRTCGEGGLAKNMNPACGVINAPDTRTCGEGVGLCGDTKRNETKTLHRHYRTKRNGGDAHEPDDVYEADNVRPGGEDAARFADSPNEVPRFDSGGHPLGDSCAEGVDMEIPVRRIVFELCEKLRVEPRAGLRDDPQYRSNVQAFENLAWRLVLDYGMGLEEIERQLLTLAGEANRTRTSGTRLAVFFGQVKRRWPKDQAKENTEQAEGTERRQLRA